MDSEVVRFLGNYQTEAQNNLVSVQNAIIFRLKNSIFASYSFPDRIYI